MRAVTVSLPQPRVPTSDAAAALIAELRASLEAEPLQETQR